MASNLTPEQRAKIELNRRLALEKRAARLANISNSPVKIATSVENIRTSTPLLSGFKDKEKCKPPDQIPVSTSFNLPRVNSYNESVILPQKDSTGNLNSSNEKPISPLKNNSAFTVKSNSNDMNLVTKPLNSRNCPNSLQRLETSCTNTANTKMKPVTPIFGTCKLISSQRFTVEVLYHQQTIDIFRTIKGKEYDSKTKLWTFPLSEYFNLKKAVSVLKPYVIIGDLPKYIIETFITKAKHYQQDLSKVDISRIDEKLKMTIYPFQQEGIQYGVSRNGRCLIADDMGLGKSIQALGIADYYRSDWPLLIACPSSMRYQWEEEIRINLPNSVSPHQVFVMTSGKDIVDGAKILILSYDLLAKKRDMVIEIGFGVFIMDESHNIKNNKTQRGKAALDVAQQCRRIILLSGTPVLSRPSELYSQIKAVDPKIFPYFKEYGLRYCGGQQTNFGWDFSGSSNMEELKLLLEARFMIRRLKSEVLTQLPSKIRQVIILNSKSLMKNNQSMDAFASKLQSSTLKGRERHGTLLQYFAETAKTKMSAVCEYITDLLQDNRKFLCFAHHADMLNSICNTLEKNKTYYIKIDGSVSAEERKILCDKFQYEEKWKVAVLSIKAANTGLTLTAAQVAIFAELFWNPGDLAQAEDRVHRIGQTDCVLVKYLIAKGTADDYLWPLIQSKLEVLNKAGLSKDSYMAADEKCLNKSTNKTETQTKINDFFNDPFSDEDNEELLKVMDEIDGVPEKKIKLGYTN